LGREDRPFAEVTGPGEVTCNVDIVASTAFMLSRWEEWKPFTPDEHGRFQAKNSVAFRQHFLDYPLVDVYGLILRAWVQSLIPRWTPPPLRLSISLTHDIDFVRPFDTVSTAARALTGDVFKRRSLGAAWDHATDLVRQWATPADNSVFQGIQQIAALSVTHGLHSAFYFMTASKSRWNDGYDLGARWVRPVLDDLRAQGLEIGFHAGYETLGNFALLQEEKQRLEALVGAPCDGGRQHYLRFEAPVTWLDWDRAGFSYDATLGYAEADGFRCGTCWPFRVFDLKNNAALSLEERPFVSMDVTLRSYLERTPNQADDILMAWAERCRAVGGIFSIIWHNDMFIRERRDWAIVYRRVVERLSAMA